MYFITDNGNDPGHVQGSLCSIWRRILVKHFWIISFHQHYSQLQWEMNLTTPSMYLYSAWMIRHHNILLSVFPILVRNLDNENHSTSGYQKVIGLGKCRKTFALFLSLSPFLYPSLPSFFPSFFYSHSPSLCLSQMESVEKGELSHSH